MSNFICVHEVAGSQKSGWRILPGELKFINLDCIKSIKKIEGNNLLEVSEGMFRSEIFLLELVYDIHDGNRHEYVISKDLENLIENKIELLKNNILSKKVEE